LLLIASGVYFGIPVFSDKSKSKEESQASKDIAIKKENPALKKISITKESPSKDIKIKKSEKVKKEKKVKERKTRNKEAQTPPAVKKTSSQLNFEDVQQLIRQHGLDINTPEQIIVNNRDTLTLSLSIDTSLQRYANRLLRRYKPRYGAIAAIDPVTGRVLAFASYAGEGESITDTDLYLKSIFPAASVFKTITAAAGIEKAGMNRKSQIPHFGRNHTLFRTQLQENLRVSRDISLEESFAYSINPTFARIALFTINKDILTDYGKRFGFNAPIPFELDNEISVMLEPDSMFSIAEFASGFNRQTSISPLFGALIASAVCEGGLVPRPTIIDSIHSSRKDTIIYNRPTEHWRRAVKEPTAKELKWLMTKVPHYGTARNTFRQIRQSPRFREYEFGGKTGNVNKQGLGRVDWFVGFGRHPQDKNQRIAVGVVTTHGEYWTVQSSYISSELIRRYLTGAQAQARAKQIASAE
jgi:cell division protein FtsI/penicillin-binding protein 2